MSIPLKLTARQQTLLANIAAEVRGKLYDVQTRDGLTQEDWDLLCKALGDEILRKALDTKPQEWDEMYDRLHRSGANS
jgi:hypothetical protein